MTERRRLKICAGYFRGNPENDQGGRQPEIYDRAMVGNTATGIGAGG